MSVKIIE